MYGCDVNYYLFDDSPDFRKNQKATDLLLTKGAGGIYVLKELNSDTSFKGETFASWDFEQYRPPVLNNKEDTVSYIMRAFIQDRLLEIYKEDKELKYRFSCYINATVFDDYIIRQKKRIPFDDSTSFSAQIISDSLHVYRHSIQKDSTPTILAGKIKCRKVGSIYQMDTWFGIQNVSYDYLSVVDTSIYTISVIKDSADKTNPDKPHYIIGKISATKESITYKELPYYSDSAEQHINDSIIVSIGLKVKDRIIGYNEAALTKIFESPVAVIKLELQKLHDFPYAGNNKSQTRGVFLYIGAGILLVFIILFLRKRRESAK
jgi:hypothetical protein